VGDGAESRAVGGGLVGLAAALLFCGCHLLPGYDAGQREILTRKVAALESLVGKASRGPIFDPRHLLVAVDADLVRRLVDAQLPREETVAERFRVRATSAQVHFDDNVGLLVLEGSVSDVEDPQGRAFAQVTLFTEVSVVELEPESGVLKGRVALLAFEVHHLRLPGRDPLALPLVSQLARLKVGAFAAFARPFEIPVALSRDLDIAGLGPGGAVGVPRGRVRLKMAVAGMLAFDGRLWVAVSADRREWSSARPLGKPEGR
jgi:hypothetical protein